MSELIEEENGNSLAQCMDFEKTEDIESIRNLIYEVNNIPIMLDSDLGKIYGVETKRINEAVRNNIDKFPKRISWVLNEEEWDCLRSKFSTLESTKSGRGHYRKYLPRVFAEQGIYMLSTVIKSKVASQVIIRIMDAFVSMRKFIAVNKDVYQTLNNINNKLIEHDEKFNYLFSVFDKKELVFFEGAVYDAYASFVELFGKAKDELIIVDMYADISLLNMIRKIKCKVILITRNSDRLNNEEISKYNSQYHNLIVIRDNSFHDRYFIIDRKMIYHNGASINAAGEKTFCIARLEDSIVIDNLIKNINDIIKLNDLSVYLDVERV